MTVKELSSRYFRSHSKEQSRKLHCDTNSTAAVVVKSPFIPRYRQIIRDRRRRSKIARPLLQLPTGQHFTIPAESPSITRGIFSQPLEQRQVICHLAISGSVPKYMYMMLVCKEFHREVISLMLRDGAYFDSPVHFTEWTVMNMDLASRTTSINIPLINVLCGVARDSYPAAWQRVVSLYQSVGMSLFHVMANMPNVKHVIIQSAEEVECSIGRFDLPRFYSDLLLGWITIAKSDLGALHFPQRITSLKPLQALTHVQVLRIISITDQAPNLALLTVEMANAIFSINGDTVQKVNFYGCTPEFTKQYAMRFGPRPDLRGLVIRLLLLNVSDPWRDDNHRIIPGSHVPRHDEWTCCVTRAEPGIG